MLEYPMRVKAYAWNNYRSASLAAQLASLSGRAVKPDLRTSSSQDDFRFT